MQDYLEDFDEVVRLHDQYQFELKLEYDLNKDNRRDRYKVETFFFLPNNLDVNESTYPKNLFYRDVLLYLRFKTPDFSLRALNDPRNERSPLAKIEEKTERFFAAPTPAAAAGLDYEVKLLGCVFKSALRDHAKSVEKTLRRLEPLDPARWAAELAGPLDDYITETRRAVERFRAARDRLKDPAVPKTLAAAFAFTDEYVSLVIEGRTHLLMQSLQAHERHDFLQGPLRRLAELVRAETAAREAMGYPSVVKEGSDNEVFVFRVGVLKKFVSSVLHFTVRTVEEGKGIREAALAVGAGVAMVFATLVAFYTQRVYGMFSLSFFTALVISYMFKDRIKAFCQQQLQRLLAQNLFDMSTNIHDHFDGARIGVCRQSVRFADEDTLDPRVQRLRDRDHITEVENDYRSERVIHYVKEIDLFSRLFVRHQSRKTGVTDILRFNVRNFLRKMDEPNIDVYTLKDGRSAALPGARVYHANLVIKFTSRRETVYERLRLVLDRQGIKRIEPVARDVLPVSA